MKKQNAIMKRFIKIIKERTMFEVLTKTPPKDNA